MEINSVTRNGHVHCHAGRGRQTDSDPFAVSGGWSCAALDHYVSGETAAL